MTTKGIPARLLRYALPTDAAVDPTRGGWDTLCGWDEAPHPDLVRPVIVALNDDTYSGDLGRMCIVHYRAVLEARAMRTAPFVCEGYNVMGRWVDCDRAEPHSHGILADAGLAPR